jgi:hypothetical protein
VLCDAFDGKDRLETLTKDSPARRQDRPRFEFSAPTQQSAQERAKEHRRKAG